MPLAFRGLTGIPNRRGVSASFVLPVHHKTYLFQLCRHIVSHDPSLVLRTDQENQRHGFAAKMPFAAGHSGSQLSHLLGYDLLRLLEVVAVFQLKLSNDVRIAGIVGKGGVQSRVSGRTQTAQDFFCEIVPIDQPVDRLTDGGNGEGIELTGT